MSILKFAAKAVGSVALVTAGVAASVVRMAADASGNDELSDMIGGVVDASFDGVKNMWADPDNPYEDDGYSSLRRTLKSKQQAAQKIKEMAQLAQKNGDNEKYDEYMARYYDLREQCNELSKELNNIGMEE